MTERKRIKTTKILLDNPRIVNNQVQGIKALLSFTISRDNEAKENKDFVQITDLIVDLAGVPIINLAANAVANRKVQWAPGFRNNVDKLRKLNGTTINFEDVPFGTKRASAAPMTQDKALEFMKGQSRLAQVTAIIEMLEGTGMDVPSSLLEEEMQLKERDNQ